jgi:hypothetical protein
MDYKPQGELQVMKTATLALRVPNSLLYFRDPDLFDRPAIDGPAAAWSTSSCAAVSCLPDCDGATTIAIGPDMEMGNDRALVVDGVLETPSYSLIVEIVPGVEVMRLDVPRGQTRLRIWTDGHRDTERVTVGLS